MLKLLNVVLLLVVKVKLTKLKVKLTKINSQIKESSSLRQSQCLAIWKARVRFFKWQ